MDLTDKTVRTIEPPQRGSLTITDKHRDAPRGFGLRVHASGTRVFILRYKADGRDRLLTVGEYPAWTLAAARHRANDYRREIDAGNDILQQRADRRAELTLCNAAERFLKTKSALRSCQDIDALLRRYVIPELGTWKITDIRRRHVISLVERITDHAPRQAALVLTYLKQIFAWAEDREIVEANPIATLRPGKVSPSLTPRRRGRVLSASEIRTFWERAETCGMHRLTALALKLVLVTGQRPGEVAGMLRSEIDGDLWTIPAERRGKTETDHVVPLTETAFSLLEAAAAETNRLGRRHKRIGNSVFEATPGRPLTPAAIARAVKRHARAIGNQSDERWKTWTPHDLRRTTRTGLAALGIDEITAESTIGHTRKGIAAVYDVHSYGEQKRAALEAWETKLLEILNRDTRCGL
jgi:integrase